MTDVMSDATRFVDEVYRERLHRPGRSSEHPIEVARLLDEDGQAPAVVLAGLLHDVLEDTDVTPKELRDRFDTGVVRLVEALTQDDTIDAYAARKAALRERVFAAGPDAASIALADKLAKLQRSAARPKIRRLAHYRALLDGVERRYGPSRLSERLRAELDRCARA